MIQGMKDSHDVAHSELELEQEALREMRKMLKALSSSLHSLCKEGKLPEHSRNLLINPQFASAGKSSTCVAHAYTHLHTAPKGGLLVGKASLDSTFILSSFRSSPMTEDVKRDRKLPCV